MVGNEGRIELASLRIKEHGQLASGELKVYAPIRDLIVKSLEGVWAVHFPHLDGQVKVILCSIMRSAGILHYAGELRVEAVVQRAQLGCLGHIHPQDAVTAPRLRVQPIQHYINGPDAGGKGVEKEFQLVDILKGKWLLEADVGGEQRGKEGHAPAGAELIDEPPGVVLHGIIGEENDGCFHGGDYIIEPRFGDVGEKYMVGLSAGTAALTTFHENDHTLLRRYPTQQDAIIWGMASISTQTQVSAGGVAYRLDRDPVQVALISVGEEQRWQLPKGLINQGESKEEAALREVREEAGIDTRLEGLIDKIEYWYYSKGKEQRVRFHKYVYFFLLRYISGDVADHDQEVNEACWAGIDEASTMLAFESEKKILAQAKEMILARDVSA